MVLVKMSLMRRMITYRQHIGRATMCGTPNIQIRTVKALVSPTTSPITSPTTLPSSPTPSQHIDFYDRVRMNTEPNLLRFVKYGGLITGFVWPHPLSAGTVLIGSCLWNYHVSNSVRHVSNPIIGRQLELLINDAAKYHLYGATAFYVGAITVFGACTVLTDFDWSSFC